MNGIGVYIPHSSDKTIPVAEGLIFDEQVYIPHSSDKTSDYKAAIKHVAEFTSLIVQIKPEPFAKIAALDGAVYIPHSSDKTSSK